MKRIAVLAAAFGLFATAAHAQSLNDLLTDLTAQMGHSNDEGMAVKSALDGGDLATACQHVSTRQAYLDAANTDLDTMQSTLDANTTMSDDVRADWQYHITDARGSIRQLSAANYDNSTKYCS